MLTDQIQAMLLADENEIRQQGLEQGIGYQYIWFVKRYDWDAVNQSGR